MNSLPQDLLSRPAKCLLRDGAASMTARDLPQGSGDSAGFGVLTGKIIDPQHIAKDFPQKNRIMAAIRLLAY
jgi:hypothetical protein